MQITLAIAKSDASTLERIDDYLRLILSKDQDITVATVGLFDIPRISMQTVRSPPWRILFGSTF